MSKKSLLIFLAFAAIYIIWGTTYLAVAFGLQGFPPFLLSGYRFLLAGAALLLWCIYKKERLPKGKALMISAISGVIMLIGGSGLVTWSMQYILSGQAAVIVATEPFIFLLLDKKRWSFYFKNKTVVAGLITGFVGITLFILFSPKSSSQELPLHLVTAGYIVLLISCLLWAGGSLYANSITSKEVSTTGIVSVQLLSAGIIGWLIGFIKGETAGFHFSDITVSAWGGLLYLVIMGSIVAHLSFMWLLTVRPPAQVSTHTFVNPVVAIFLGWLIAKEPVHPLQLAAVAIIIVGVILTNKWEATGNK